MDTFLAIQLIHKKLKKRQSIKTFISFIFLESSIKTLLNLFQILKYDIKIIPNFEKIAIRSP